MSIARGEIFESRVDLDTAECAMYRAEYTNGPPWDPVTGPRERGIVTGRVPPADSFFSYHIAAYWRNQQKDEGALQALFPKILWDAFKGEASAGLSQPFDSSLNDVVTDSIYPASFAGHLSKVQGMPKCYNLPSETKRWKRKMLLLPEGGEATLADWADDEQGQESGDDEQEQESGDDEQEPMWRCFPDRDAITLEPPGRTSLFSVMGVRVHTRLMAIALVQMCGGGGYPGPAFEIAANFETLQRTHGGGAVTAAGGEGAENTLNGLLSHYEANWQNPGDLEETLSLRSLALALQGQGVGAAAVDLVPLVSPEGKFVDKLVQLYQPSRIRKPRRVRMGASPDGWLVQQFAHNAWSAVCALTSSSGHPLCAIAVEKRVVWPFGLHTAKGGWQTTRGSCGKPYETRIDLVCAAVGSRDQDVTIIEYKTKMERTNGNPNGLFLLGGKCQSDCQQPVLNAWLYYLQTGVLPDQAVVLYATRRYDPLELRAAGVQVI